MVVTVILMAVLAVVMVVVMTVNKSGGDRMLGRVREAVEAGDDATR